METTQISRFLFELGRLSIQAGVLVLLVLVAQWAFRKRLAPRWRSALWLLVAVRLVMPFSFSSVTSIFNLLPNWPQADAAAPLPQRVARVDAAGVAIMPMAFRNDPSSVTARPVPAAVPFPVPALAPRWPVWFLTAWLAGVVFLGGRIAVSSIRFWRRCRKLQPLSEPGAIVALEECCERLGVKSRPMLIESAEVKSPGLHGLWRPRLLLPKGFMAQFSLAELQFVFLHELAHLKRRDLLWNWVMAVLQVVHWFNPLVWLGFSRWRSDREMACDAMALEAAGRERNQEYGRTILRLLEHFAHPVATPDVVGILEDKRQLHRRIAMIAGYMPAKGWPVLAAVVAAGLAAIGLTDARSQAPVGELLSVTNSQQRSGTRIRLKDRLATAGGSSGVTLVSTPATSNSLHWHAEWKADSETASNWNAATSNFNAWQAQFSAMGATASSQPAMDLTGAWVLVGTPDKIGKAPKAGGRFKFYAGHLFATTQAEPKTGVVIFHHGGSFTVNGEDYSESVTYANPTTLSFIGQTNGHFKIKLEGDLLTLIGTDNSYKEVWKRLEAASSDSSQIAKDMVGVWAYAGKIGDDGKVPESGVGLKFITPGAWCDTQPDSKTGVVLTHHGGNWVFKGSDYVETVQYANPGSMNLIGHAFKFNAAVEGDTLTLKGVGNPWNEVWKRVR